MQTLLSPHNTVEAEDFFSLANHLALHLTPSLASNSYTDQQLYGQYARVEYGNHIVKRTFIIKHIFSHCG